MNPLIMIRHAGIALSFAVLITGCSRDNAGSNDVREQFLAHREDVLSTFTACSRDSTTSQATLVAESRCSVFSVPENYAEPGGRQIELKVMVIPALTDLALSDPLFLMAGGPGQAATDLVQVAQVFARVRTERDIVLVDQRGTGELSPFDCQLSEEEAAELDAQDPGFEEMLSIQLAVIRDCLDTMDAAPQYYTTDIAMRDLDSIRQWLGYPRINLWGASYGSRSSLAYLQSYPEFVRTVIIDAIAPPALSLPLYNERDASAALEKLMLDCAAQDDCNTAFPDLAAHYDELLARLQQPQPVSILNGDDFRTIDTTISDFEFHNFLRQVLYSREAQRLIPLIIEQAWQGNYRPVFALAGQYSETGINQGMFLSVICSEDYSLLTDELLAEESGIAYRIESALFNEFILEACELWPTRELPASYFEPVAEDKPVLIFSGEVDPVTPPAWGDLVDASLPDSLHLVLQGFGHGTLFTQCTVGIMTNFIESGSLAGLDTGCTAQFRRRPFFVTPGGSSLADD